ncbi:uncharacterized protein SCHCODRAFT_02515116 [Schizophyllum commune H4-8]|nr:uncharacterized protein SCHCODRAFT_02515116 [Schizophyllum commune H4-8]KAI5887588.1 hypothetical protein SCHCODRAFT_02515116 [Schizophyllum commune H4-8]
MRRRIRNRRCFRTTQRPGSLEGIERSSSSRQSLVRPIDRTVLERDMSASSGPKRDDLPPPRRPPPPALVSPLQLGRRRAGVSMQVQDREEESIRRARPSNIGGSGSMSSDSDRRGSSSGSGTVGGRRTSLAGPIVETCSTLAVSPPGESGAFTGEFATSVTVDSPRPAQRSATRTKGLNVIERPLNSRLSHGSP